MMLSVKNFVLVIVVVGGEFATSRGEKSPGAGSKGEPCTRLSIYSKSTFINSDLYLQSKCGSYG